MIQHRNITDHDLIWAEYFNSEEAVRINDGDPDVGATSPTFFQGDAVFDGVTAEIDSPGPTFNLSRPERAFSIRTRVYLTDTDGSVFLQLYYGAVLEDHRNFRFYIAGNWPVSANRDKLAFELWDNVGTAGSIMKGRIYDQVLTTLAKDVWTEFVCTYDGRGGATPGAGICLYMNGVQVDDANTETAPLGGDYVSMKRYSDLVYQVGRNVEGKMQLLEVYNKVLTLEEVKNLYNNKRYKELNVNEEILNVSVQSGSIQNKYSGDTINGNLVPEPVNTATTIVKDGEVNAMDFNGTNSQIICGDYDTLDEDLTIITWAKPYGWANGDFTIFDNESFKLRAASDHSWIVISNSPTFAISADNSFVEDEWQSVIATRTSAGVTNIYINGILSGSADQSSGVPEAGIYDFSVGARSADGHSQFDGLIGDVRILKGLLSTEEINQIWTSEKHKYLK